MTTITYNMATKILTTLVVGVLIGVVRSEEADQSEIGVLNDQPMVGKENIVGKRPLPAPEVVVQLKYDGGELDRIYLAQFRKETKDVAPSVQSRSNLCADLCHAGLGGLACGSTCSAMMPIGLQSALNSTNDTEVIYGEPRFEVCPTLCANQLGFPLCSCKDPEKKSYDPVDWSSICSSFCASNRYVLNGCPPCDQTTTSSPTTMVVNQSSRSLNTAEGWVAWCNVQCRQGQGGAACNCDRAPFQ